MIDKTDRKIIDILLENSRLSYRRVAKRAGLSVATVIKRMVRMEKENIIKKYSAVLDYDELGYDIHAIIDIKCEKGQRNKVLDWLSNNKNVYSIYDMTGGIDVLAIVKFLTRKKLHDFLNGMHDSPMIEKTHTTLILNVVKEANHVF